MVQALDDTRPRRLIAPMGGNGASAGRVPPHNLEAEESLLGAMLLSRDAIASAMEICNPEDFYKSSHGHIFAAITSLFSQGEPADWVTVTEELRRRGLARDHRRSLGVRLLAGEHAVDRKRRVLRPRSSRSWPCCADWCRWPARSPSSATASPRMSPRCSTEAESLVFDVAQRRVVDSMTPLRDLLGQGLDHLQRLYDQGRLDHRPGHRLHRSRRAAGRVAAVQSHRGGGPPRHGQDRLRPRHGGPCRHQVERADAAVLLGDEPSWSSPSDCSAPRPGSTPTGCGPASCSSPIGRRSATPSVG